MDREPSYLDSPKHTHTRTTTMLTCKHVEAIAAAIADIHIDSGIYAPSNRHDMYTRGVTEMRHAIAHNLADYCEGNNTPAS